MNMAATEFASDRDIVSELIFSETVYDIFRILKHVTIDSGFKCFNLLKLPDDEPASMNDLSIITNWNPELIGAYDKMGFISNSPVIKALKESTQPFVWRLSSVNEGRSDNKADDVQSLFTEFGLLNGVYFHTVDAKNTRGTLGLAGDRPDPSHDELVRLSYIANHAFERASNLVSIQPKTADVLTDREKECIYWTANGKTSSEVAQILGISENTVNHYMSSSALKLDTVNKAHTVAKAIRLGMIANIT
jgi:DNA-binding CsgD family transcriptional regulator